MTKFLKILTFVLIVPFLLSSCKGPDGKFGIPGGDARKTPADPALARIGRQYGCTGLAVIATGTSRGNGTCG